MTHQCSLVDVHICGCTVFSFDLRQKRMIAYVLQSDKNSARESQEEHVIVLFIIVKLFFVFLIGMPRYLGLIYSRGNSREE